MAVRTRVDPIDRDIDVLISQELSPTAQSARLADFARQELARGQQVNRSVLGRVPPHRTFVDQRENAPLASVRPDGVIVFEFDLIETALAWIGEMLVRHSPVRSGRFQKSWLLFADGVEVEPGKVPAGALEYAFVNSQPYSRKIERGLSPQAPEGVADVVATLARARWGNVAKIRFSFRPFPGGAIGAWANTPSARAMAKTIRKGRASTHHDWLTNQPAVIVSPFGGASR